MDSETTTSNEITRQRSAPRSGPVGRSARVVLAALLGLVGYDLWVDRFKVFASSDPVSDIFLWIFTGFIVYSIYDLMSVIDRGKQALAAIGAIAVVAAGVALVVEGTAWTAPLTWLVWALAFGGLVTVIGLLVLAVFIGTPGCEGGILRNLLLTGRGERDDRPMFCLAGLHAIDAWERRQSWRRAN